MTEWWLPWCWFCSRRQYLIPTSLHRCVLFLLSSCHVFFQTPPLQTHHTSDSPPPSRTNNSCRPTLQNFFSGTVLIIIFLALLRSKVNWFGGSQHSPNNTHEHTHTWHCVSVWICWCSTTCTHTVHRRHVYCLCTWGMYMRNVQSCSLYHLLRCGSILFGQVPLWPFYRHANKEGEEALPLLLQDQHKTRWACLHQSSSRL